MSKYFEYHLKKAPRIQYEAYFTGLVFGLAPIAASVFFDEHLLFGFPFGWQTAEPYLCISLVVFFLASMLAHSYEDEIQNFRFGQDGFYWDNGSLIEKQTFYRPAEKIRRISFTRSGKLKLTDSLGETFRADNLAYSELAEKQLAECFPRAWVPDTPVVQAENKISK